MSERVILGGAELVDAKLADFVDAVKHAHELAEALVKRLPSMRSSRRGNVSMARFELARARLWAELALEEDLER